MIRRTTMAELTSQDRLQPSLLDRLIDHEPRSTKESSEARALSRTQLRAAVLRDLGWLFNATRPEPEPKSDSLEEIARWREAEQARRSVLNYGLPAFAGVTLASLDLDAIRRIVAEAVKAFEPRIEPRTLVIEARSTGEHHHNTLQLLIRGHMWAPPVPLELLLAADVDVETGTTQVRDLRA
jgi:type VI secretion system protein ImpF